MKKSTRKTAKKIAIGSAIAASAYALWSHLKSKGVLSGIAPDAAQCSQLKTEWAAEGCDAKPDQSKCEKLKLAYVGCSPAVVLVEIPGQYDNYYGGGGRRYYGGGGGRRHHHHGGHHGGGHHHGHH